MKQKLTLTGVQFDDNCVVHDYECDFIAECDGSSLWSDTENKQVRVHSISVIHTASDDEFFTEVHVGHDSTWDIYTDKGFEEEISAALGFDVSFTEQGMQDDGFASMEC